MSRIYVALTDQEIERLDELKGQWEIRCGCSISRQKFARTLLSRELNSENEKREI